MVAKDHLQGLTLLLLPRELIFVNKARLALNARLPITLAALAMCQMEVQLRFILGIPQLILIEFLLTMIITMVPIEPQRLDK